MKGFMKKVIEAISVKFIVETFFAILFLVFGYINRDVILNFFSFQIPMWEMAIAIVGLLFVVGIALKINSNRKSRAFFSVIRGRPSHIDYAFNVDMFGVKWRALYGHSFGNQYAFSEGPFCPTCMFEMDSVKKGFFFTKRYWHCIPCNKYYRIPTESSYDAGKAVERYIESEIRSGRIKLDRFR